MKDMKKDEPVKQVEKPKEEEKPVVAKQED
jgi:hypothetical protein